MGRVVKTCWLTVVTLALTAPAALAVVEHPGEGIYGEANDKVITAAGFVIIMAIPLFITIMSLLQYWLDKRKDERKAAEKARRARADARHGW